MILAIGTGVPSAATGIAAIAWGFALACCMWAIKERERREAFQRTAAAEEARARAETLLRDSLIEQVQEAIVVWDADNLQHLSFGEGARLLDACLAGPDRESVSVALDSLRRNGTAFQIKARHSEGVLALRGCPVGRHATLFLHREHDASNTEPDCRDAGGGVRSDTDANVHALNSLPLALAIFGSDRRLAFCNRSYVRLWGLEKDWLERRPTAGEILDRLRELRRLPEQSDFAAWKRDHLKLFDDAAHSSEEVWHLPNGTTVCVTSRPRPEGGLLYLLEDVSDRLRQESAYNALIKVQQATLNMLQEAVAVFGTDGRLRLHNTAFARLWQLDEDDLQGAPHLNGIAESCTARFGERAIWEIISSSVTAASPKELDGSIVVERRDGRIVSLSLARLPDGAVLITFTDITDHMRLESVLREASTAAA